MKKFNKNVAVILGTMALAIGAFAIPAFADTTDQNPMGTIGNMQSFMASGTMQSIHNNQAMQDAMNSGDVSKIADAMNTPELKQIMGEEHVNQMTEYMKNGNFQAMHGQGGMMGGTGANNMMGGFTRQQ